MKRNENFWSYRLHKLGTSKVLRTDGRTDGRTDRQTNGVDPLLDLLSLKATQIKNMKRAQNRRCTSSICEQSLGKV